MSVKKSIVDGVEIIEDTETGVTHFRPVEQPKPAIVVDNRSWWQKVCDWWNETPVKPYVKCRDFNNGPDTNGENQCKAGIEAGIKIEF